MKYLIVLILILSSCSTQEDRNYRRAKLSVKEPILVCETPEGCKIYTTIIGGYATNIIVCKEPYNASISK